MLVDEGLPGKITAIKRDTIPGVLDPPPLDTWLYTVQPGAGGEPQANVPEYNVVPRAELDWPDPLPAMRAVIHFDHRNRQYPQRMQDEPSGSDRDRGAVSWSGRSPLSHLPAWRSTRSYAACSGHGSGKRCRYSRASSITRATERRAVTSS